MENKSCKQVKVNGLTQHDYKDFSDTLVKANWENLVELYNQLVQEMGRRTALKPQNEHDLCPDCRMKTVHREYKEDGATFKTDFCQGCGRWW